MSFDTCKTQTCYVQGQVLVSHATIFLAHSTQSNGLRGHHADPRHAAALRHAGGRRRHATLPVSATKTLLFLLCPEQQRKMLSTTRFGAFQANTPKDPLIRRNYFLQTPAGGRSRSPLRGTRIGFAGPRWFARVSDPCWHWQARSRH